MSTTLLKKSSFLLIFEATTPQDGQTHSNNLSVVADESFEFVWPCCAVDA